VKLLSKHAIVNYIHFPSIMKYERPHVSVYCKNSRLSQQSILADVQCD